MQQKLKPTQLKFIVRAGRGFAAKSMALIFIAASLYLLPNNFTASAHPGHDAPVKLKSKFGGMVKAGKAIDLEYRVQKGELRVWPRAHDGEVLKSVQLTATMTPPRGKAQNLPLQWDEAQGVAIAQLNFGKNHRLAMEVSLQGVAEYQAKATPFKEQFKFQAEK